MVNNLISLYIFVLNKIADLHQQRLEWLLGFPQPFLNRYENYGLFESLDQQVWSYESTLFWNEDNISYLNYIYQNKEKFQTLCLVCLDKLLSLVLTIPSLRNYLLELPAPCPIYFSYFDWMRPFVMKIKEEFKKNSASKTAYDREEHSKLALQKLEQLYTSPFFLPYLISPSNTMFPSNLEEIDVELGSQIPSEEQKKWVKGNFPLIIIGKGKMEHKIGEEEVIIQREKIVLSIYEYEVFLCESLPNPELQRNEIFESGVTNEKGVFISRSVHPDSEFFKIVNSYYWDENRRKTLLKQEMTDEDEEEGEDEDVTPRAKKNFDLKVIIPEKAEKLAVADSPQNVQNIPDIENQIEQNKKKPGKIKEKITLLFPKLEIKERKLFRKYVVTNESYENIKITLHFLRNDAIFAPVSVIRKSKLKSNMNILTVMLKNPDVELPALEFEISCELVDTGVSFSDQKALPLCQSYDEYDENVGKKRCGECTAWNSVENDSCYICTKKF